MSIAMPLPSRTKMTLPSIRRSGGYVRLPARRTLGQRGEFCKETSPQNQFCAQCTVNS